MKTSSSRIVRTLASVSAGAALLFLMNGCASVVGADFDEAVATPTQCSIVAPQTANERSYARCNSNSTCTFDEKGTGTSCVGLTSYGAVGDVCQYANECSPGLACTTALGCAAYCVVGSTCADGAACIAFANADEFSTKGENYGFCPPPSCDPMHPDEPEGELGACGSGQCRFIAADRTACFTVPAGKTPSGAACEDDLDCRPQSTCFEGHCEMLCRVGQDDCISGSSCVEGASDVQSPTLAGTTYGHCVRD